MKAITKATFKAELNKAPDLMLAFEQLNNEFPLYSVVIMAAFAEVAASRVNI